MGKIETLATELGELLNNNIPKLVGPQVKLRRDINRFLSRNSLSSGDMLRNPPKQKEAPPKVDPLADLKAMSEEGLRAKAKDAKIKGYALMKKETLIERLSK